LRELPDEAWAVIGPIIFPEGDEGAQRSDTYPWLFGLDEQRREEFVDYCVELDCWHEELEFAGFDLETATFSYSREMYGESAPHYRRLALIYHSDNVDHRIYAYREKVFQFVSLFFGGIASSDKREDLKRTVRAFLDSKGHRRVLTLLNRLEDDRKTRPVAEALIRRRKLVHALAIRRWKSLQARRRVEEFMTELTESEAVRQEANLEALIKEGKEEIERVCVALAAFRVDLVQALKDAARR
jgi:hypothetical protein